jgi:hypothetical protein
MTDAEIINTISKIEDRIDSDLDFLASRIIDLQATCAMLSGAVSHGMSQPDSYFLARAIFTIYGDERNHAPPSIIMNKEIDNLAKVL